MAATETWQLLTPSDTELGFGFGGRTVGEGDVQVALPGQLARLVYRVLRCGNTTTDLVFTAHSQIIYSKIQWEVAVEVAVACCSHTGRRPSIALSLEVWI